MYGNANLLILADTAPAEPASASLMMILGAGCFGAVLGWYLYYVNRYRKDEVKLGDVATLVGVIGGGAILALFPKGTDLFGAYGIGLAIGFFLYFLILVRLVKVSPGFTWAYLIDGRRPKLGPDDQPGGDRPMVG